MVAFVPELPEVETTVRGLRKRILNLRIEDVWTDTPKIIHLRQGFGGQIKRPASFPEFKKQLKGKKIEKIWRAGKNIILNLSGGFSLLCHQKLTGHLLYGKWNIENGKWQAQEKGPLAKDPTNRFLHLIFWLNNGWQFALSDLRKFAKIELWQAVDLKKSEDLKRLGPDALARDLSLEKFSELLRKKKGKIKQVLMDQTTIAGIGNIYSDEVLFAAQAHPLKEIKILTAAEIRKIYQAMRKILKEAVKLHGESISDYRTVTGEKGRFDKERKAYRREGEKCFRCGAIIKRIKIGVRSAHYCPRCQK